MKLTLRKANALQNVIQTALSAVTIRNTVDINEFQDVEQQIEKANTELMANDIRRSDLLMSLYTIRSLVGQANSQTGISGRLTHAAFIDKRLAQLATLISEEGQQADITVVKGRMEKIKNRKEDAHAYYGRGDTVSTGLVKPAQAETIRQIVQELRKQKQDINDDILELNIKTEIELSDEVEMILQREGIV